MEFKKLNQSESLAPFKILNLGNGKIKLMKFIKESKINLVKSKNKFYEISKKEYFIFSFKIKETKKYFNYKPKVDVKKGISLFISWYKNIILFEILIGLVDIGIGNLGSLRSALTS